MKKKHLLIFVLLLSILGVASSCKKSEKAVSRHLQSYKTEYSLQSMGQGGGATILQYDEQQRLTAWNNDTIRWHYAYRADGDIDMYGEFLRDGTKEFTGTITLNEAGLPDVEEYSFFVLPVPAETPAPEVIKYTYDEKNRPVSVTDKVEAGDYSYTIHATFLYEGADNNATCIRYEWEMGGRTYCHSYRFEYLDEANPVDFYPELVMIGPMNDGFQITGRAGYKRSKLLKQMIRLDEENMETAVIDFSYNQDADGHITECTLVRRLLNDEAPVESNDSIRFYEIKY